MEWTISINEDERYVEIVTNGIADKDGSLAMVKAIASALSTENIKLVLIDHRNISKVSGGVVDVYHRPDELDKIGMSHNIKVAEIIKPEHQKFFDILETVCVNRGYSFSVFKDKSIALKWLLEA